MIRKLTLPKLFLLLTLIFSLTVISFSSCVEKEPETWSFGVMGDTQWTPFGFKDGKSVPGYDPEGNNPSSVSASIITQINKEFIAKGVKFVIQVGDITDWGTDEAIASRARAAEELYNAGIGFFCMRGNHETYNNLYFRDAPPNDYGIPAIQKHFPQNRGMGNNLFGAHNFSSPSSDEADLENMEAELAGMSYSFDYGSEGNNATFIIIDPWATKTRSEPIRELLVNYGYTVKIQQPWISERLDKSKRGTEHAFVFSHQPLMAANHVDSPFGFLDSNQEEQNTFYRELNRNDAAFYIAGHDHIHQRNMVKSPDGKSEIEQLICISACPKFYRSRPDESEGWHGQKYRSTTISQEIDNVGFYIFTIDGPIVTVDYYSDRKGGFAGGNKWPDGSGSLITPEFDFIKKESWSYSLNGKSFIVKRGDSYSVVKDTFEGTTARVIGGDNNSPVVDDLGRPLAKKISTGWKTVKTAYNPSCNVFYLSGMADMGSAATDTFALELSYDEKSIKKDMTGFLAAENEGKGWVNAVDLNSGGTKEFVEGPYKPSYPLGTYGMDKANNTVWAVINYNGYFTTGWAAE